MRNRTVTRMLLPPRARFVISKCFVTSHAAVGRLLDYATFTMCWGVTMRMSAALRSGSMLALCAIASLAMAQSTGTQSLETKDNSKTATLTRAQFDQLLAKPEQLLIVDVRRP